MTACAVVAYPTMSDGDREWIECIRARYDPAAARIPAHVTLVFPLPVTETAVVDHVSAALRARASIPMTLVRAAAFPDPADGGYRVHLLVGDGNRELVELHDALYEGALSTHRRRDIPFVPHVTVGTHPRLRECERIAREIDDEHRIVRARIDSVDVVAVAASAVGTVARIPLGRAEVQAG